MSDLDETIQLHDDTGETSEAQAELRDYKPVARTTARRGLPDLSHDWRPVFEDGKPTRYECSCLLSAPVPYRALCPDRVLAWGDEREEEGREAGRRALEELRDAMGSARDKAEEMAFRSRDLYYSGMREAHEEDAKRVADALATLTDPEQA